MVFEIEVQIFLHAPGYRRKRADASIYFKASSPRAVITRRADPGLVTQGWVGDKACLVTANTAAYVTVTRPNIAAGWPER
jgi:hypothetical protein